MNYILKFMFFVLMLGVGSVGAKLTEKDFFKDREFIQVKISPDGKMFAATYDAEKETKMVVLDLEDQKVISGFAFGKNKHIDQIVWVGNESLLLQVNKRFGYLDDRRTEAHLVSVSVDGKRREEVWDFQRSDLWVVSRLEEDDRRVVVAKRHWADEGEVKLHSLDVVTGKLRYLHQFVPIASGNVVSAYGLDTNDKIRIAIEYSEGEKKYDSDDDLVYIHYKGESGKWRKLRVNDVQREVPSFDQVGFDKNNEIFYFTSNFDMKEKDRKGLFSLDTKSGNVKLLYRHPDVDILGGIYGKDRELIGVYLEPGYPTVHYIDEKNETTKALKSLQATFPTEYVSFSSFSRDGRTAVVRTRSDKNPGTYYKFDFRKKTLKYLASSMPQLNMAKDELPSSEPFKMTARDGLEMYGFLTLPKGKEKNLPLIILPHGGPYGPFDSWGFDPEVSYLAYNGYAVIQLNFRGSGGYGVDFERNAYQKWGREMQDDLTDATLWAINNGIADPDRICIYGGSYGGYAALQGVVREPDLYRCAVGYVGVYSIPLMFEKGDYLKSGKYAESFLTNFHGTDEAVHRSVSPAFHVEKIKASLFIVHGEDDQRVPVEHAYVLKEALDKIGKGYEWLVVEDEGHGFQKEENKFRYYPKLLNFFDKHIGKN